MNEITRSAIARASSIASVPALERTTVIRAMAHGPTDRDECRTHRRELAHSSIDMK